MGYVRKALLIAGVSLIAACADREPNLLNVESNSTDTGPDEFSVLPQNPLKDPPSYASLPPPGGRNIADLEPRADAAVALGGRASATRPTGNVAGSPLLAYTTRFGTGVGIRNQLAAEDLEYRRDHNPKLLERAFAVNVYFTAYEPMSLDQYAELARLSALGIITPAAPPQPVR